MYFNLIVHYSGCCWSSIEICVNGPKKCSICMWQGSCTKEAFAFGRFSFKLAKGFKQKVHLYKRIPAYDPSHVNDLFSQSDVGCHMNSILLWFEAKYLIKTAVCASLCISPTLFHYFFILSSGLVKFFQILCFYLKLNKFVGLVLL